MFDLLDGALVEGEWLELRFHDRRARTIAVEDGRLEVGRSTRHAGAKAAAQKSTAKITVPTAAWRNGTYESPARLAVADKTLDEKFDLVLKTEAMIKKASRRVTSSSVRYVEILDEKTIVTSDGA